jgi:hypothetical protein
VTRGSVKDLVMEIICYRLMRKLTFGLNLETHVAWRWG